MSAAHLVIMSPKTNISNSENLKKYMSLDQKGKIMAEYVWIDANSGVRSKTKVGFTTISLC